MPVVLTQEGREELALALIFLKDFKSQGLFDLQVTEQMLKMADLLGVRAEFERLLTKIPPMKIEPRHR